jgi:hypothetical protein
MGPKWLTLNTEPQNSLADFHFNYIVDPRSVGETARIEKYLTLGQLQQMVVADPVVSLFVAGLMAQFTDIPEAKQVQNLIAQRITMMMGQEQQQQQMQNVAGKLGLVDKVNQMRNPQNGKPTKKAA